MPRRGGSSGRSGGGFRGGGGFRSGSSSPFRSRPSYSGTSPTRSAPIAPPPPRISSGMQSAPGMGLGGAMASGLAFGAGAGLAHGAVSSMMGGGRRDEGGSVQPYPNE